MVRRVGLATNHHHQRRLAHHHMTNHAPDPDPNSLWILSGKMPSQYLVHGRVNHLTLQNTVPMSTSTPANTHQLANKAKDVKKIPTEFNSSRNKVSHYFGQFLTLQNEGAASCLFVPILVPASKRDVMLSPTDHIADWQTTCSSSLSLLSRTS